MWFYCYYFVVVVVVFTIVSFMFRSLSGGESAAFHFYSAGRDHANRALVIVVVVEFHTIYHRRSLLFLSSLPQFSFGHLILIDFPVFSRLSDYVFRSKSFFLFLHVVEAKEMDERETKWEKMWKIVGNNTCTRRYRIFTHNN